MATVLNNSSDNIYVAVSMQKGKEDGHYFLIKPNQQETWDRKGGATAFILGPPFTTKKTPKIYFIAEDDDDKTIIIKDWDLE